MGELIVNALKFALIIAIAGTFLVAINALIQGITTIVFGGVIGEVFGIISCCLPFNASAVFQALGTSCSIILAFMVASKIWDLTVTAADAT